MSESVVHSSHSVDSNGQLEHFAYHNITRSSTFVLVVRDFVQIDKSLQACSESHDDTALY